MNKKGNSFIISIFIIAIILIIFIFISAIYFGIVNSLIYNIKLEMYSANKSAILAVNKSQTSRGEFSYSEKDFKRYFEDNLKSNYDLDDNLENKNGLVQKVEILDYEIIQSGKRDNYTKDKITDNTIHSVIRVKIKPLILEEQLANLYEFDIHEDVVLNKVIM